MKEEPRTVKPDQIIEQKEAVAEKRERRSRFAEPETEPMVMAALKIAPVSPPRPVSVQPDPLICPSCKREPRAERIDVPGKLSVRCYPCSFEEARMSRIRGTREGFLEMLGLREGYSFDR